MSKFSLTCFGVGDGWPCADRLHASFLYRLGKVTLLVDCGERVSGSFKATGLPCDTIDRIFLSHLHADHFAGFFMLVKGFWLERRRKELSVHLPADSIKPLRQMLNTGFLFKELLKFRLRFTAWRSGRTERIGDVRITPFRTTHLERLRARFQRKYPQDFEAFCFLIEAGKRRVGHSADLGRPEDLEPLVREPLDLLVCELAHFCAEELFAYLRGRPIKRIVLLHLARRYWENLGRVRTLATRMLPRIPVSFARDNDKFSF